MKLLIRRFIDEDAVDIARIVKRNFLEVNIFDYSEQEMKKIAEIYDVNKIRKIASYAHMYVVLDDHIIVGTGSISSYFGSEEESILLTIFVMPEYQNRSVGKLIMQTLEQDEFFKRARRVEIASSITAYNFYMKFGYHFKNGSKVLDNEGLYRMEKFIK